LARLSTTADLDQALDESRQRPVLILKHSPSCGASFRALDEVSDWVQSGPRPAVCYLIDVLRDRATSNEVASRFGIRHESPQVLLIVDGAVRWHASHYRVTETAIDAALAAVRA
jgi:bacillithiol system protein YtxJ